MELPGSIFYTLKIAEETDTHIRGIDKFGQERIVKKSSIEQAWPAKGDRNERPERIG